jgi:Ca2+/Na+ antiporter
MNNEHSHPGSTSKTHKQGGMGYLRFAAMIGTSTLVMYGLMYLNTYRWEHVSFSETRTYMALLMGACMAIIMLSFMLKMYRNQRVNIGIYVFSLLVFVVALWLVRSQKTVGDVSYMRAMIPHHSIAILTSERAQIRDARVRKLADQIIESQRKEIAEMKILIAELQARGVQPAETKRVYQDGDADDDRTGGHAARDQHPLGQSL